MPNPWVVVLAAFSALAPVAHADSSSAFAAKPGQSRDHPNCISPVLPAVQESIYTYRTVLPRTPEPTAHLRAYVFAPAGPAPVQGRPAILMFHGGAFKEGFPVTWFPAARYYASRGIVAIPVQYRLQYVHGSRQVESMRDAFHAFKWVRQNARRLGVDPARIVAAGDSAGGHLALSLALLNRDASAPTRPRAVMAIYPLIETRLKSDPRLSLLTSLSPANLPPPTFLMQGTADSQPTTPPAATRAFCDRANALSVRGPICRATFVPGPEYYHGFIGGRAQYRLMLHYFDEFLRSQGLLAEARPFDAAADRLDPECEAEASGKIFGDWLKEYGYSSNTSSRW